MMTFSDACCCRRCCRRCAADGGATTHSAAAGLVWAHWRTMLGMLQRASCVALIHPRQSSFRSRSHRRYCHGGVAWMMTRSTAPPLPHSACRSGCCGLAAPTQHEAERAFSLPCCVVLRCAYCNPVPKPLVSCCLVSRLSPPPFSFVHTMRWSYAIACALLFARDTVVAVTVVGNTRQ